MLPIKNLPRTAGGEGGAEKALEPAAYRRCGGGGQLYGKPTTEKVLWRGELCRCARNRIIPPSRLGIQPLVMLCGLFWRSRRNRYLLVLVIRALCLPRLSMHVLTYRNSINKCSTMVPTLVPWSSLQ